MADVANRDEAVKCLRIASRARDEGNLDKAQRFAEKAQKLFPSQQGASLLQEVQNLRSGSQSNGASARPAARPGAEGMRHRHPQGQAKRASTARKSTEAPKEDPNAGTPEQRAMVRKIRSTKDYYQILGVDRSASDDEIKKAYRKLALKLHPDKNSAAGAEEAFKAVSKAFSTLQDADKRAEYDRFGPDGPPTMGSMRRGPRAGPSGFGGGDFSADEAEMIFRMFFGGGGPFGGGMGGPFGGAFHQAGPGFNARPVHRRSRRTRAGHVVDSDDDAGGFASARRRGAYSQAPQDPFMVLVGRLMALLPLLLLGLMMLGGSGPEYVLEKKNDYRVPMVTTFSGREVPYFVKDRLAFRREFPPHTQKLERLELNIEKDYKEKLKQECTKQRQVRALLTRQRRYNDAASVSMAPCMTYQELFTGPPYQQKLRQQREREQEIELQQEREKLRREQELRQAMEERMRASQATA
ncbi:unnamed protein product [Pedinophyceae sp. YPF-701]|nr:unnamed protein product [Pedinophyceae sp. YPF-701]